LRKPQRAKILRRPIDYKEALPVAADNGGDRRIMIARNAAIVYGWFA
jgi:hypothetical protein